MKKQIFFLVLLLPFVNIFPQSQAETELKVLNLNEVIEIAREQSLMALMSRHQFRGSYWEYRTHIARFRPGLTLEATVPSLNNTMESVTQPDGTEKFVTRSNMRTSLDLQLNQNIGLTG
ncbi:MAG TPA: TolC family protein, partial [Bacteroides sp.]|nr:TolC family protein [Bacteroides sp.]